jgi:hypothetical protein
MDLEEQDRRYRESCERRGFRTSDEQRDHDCQAACAMLQEILTVAKRAGLPDAVAEGVITPTVAYFLDRASGPDLARVGEVINFEVWNARRQQEDL